MVNTMRLLCIKQRNHGNKHTQPTTNGVDRIFTLTIGLKVYAGDAERCMADDE